MARKTLEEIEHHEAYLRGQELLEQIEMATSWAHIKPVVIELIRDLYPQHTES